MIFALCAISFGQIIEEDDTLLLLDSVTTKASPGNIKHHYKAIRYDSLCMGSLKIDVTPPNATVYLNEIKIGEGSQFLDSMQCGIYYLCIAFEKRKKIDTIFVQPNQISTVNYYVDRTVRLYMESSYSQYWIHKKNCFGPNINLGIKYKNTCFGIGADYSHKSNRPHPGFWEYVELTGGYLQWLNEYYIQGRLSMLLGASIGYWYSSTCYYDTTQYGEWYDDYLFTMAQAKLQYGYKHLYLNIGFNVLFGTSVAFLIKPGILILI